MTSATISARATLKGRGKSASAKSKKKVKEDSFLIDRATFDKSLDESLSDLENGRVYKLDPKDSKTSLKKILREPETKSTR